MESKKEYFKISKLQFPIIGNNETDIVHIVLKPKRLDIIFVIMLDAVTKKNLVLFMISFTRSFFC